MLDRHALHRRIETALGRSRIVVLVGPRQAGKTTLARAFVADTQCAPARFLWRLETGSNAWAAKEMITVTRSTRWPMADTSGQEERVPRI